MYVSILTLICVLENEMTLGFDKFCDGNVRNKRQAYAAMCKSVCLIFAITFLSLFLNEAVAHILSKNLLKLESFFVGLLERMGVARTFAIIAVRDFISSGVLFEFIGIVSLVLTMVIPAALFAKFMGFKKGECFNVGGRLVKGFFCVFCIGQLFTLAASFFSNGIYDFLIPPVTGVYTGSFTAYSADIFMFVMDVLFTCILVPVIEEYVFRGVLFGYLRRYGLTFGILSSAVLFGLSHSAPVQSVYAFTFGVLSAFVLAVTGNIKTSILLHASNNFVTVVTGYVQIFTGEIMATVVYCVYLMTVIVFAFLGIRKFVSEGGLYEEFSDVEKENDGGLCEKPGIAQIFTIPLLLYIALYAYRFLSQVI